MAGHLVIVPTMALKDPRLSHAEFKTLCHISTFASTENGWCWFLMATLAEDMGLTVRVVRGYVKRLVDLGYVVRKAQFKDGQQRCNSYQVVLNTSLNRGAAVQQPGGEAKEQPGGAAAEQPPERSFFNDKDIYRPLARPDFLREIDGAFKDGGFGEFDHLTESEIFLQAGACWDFLQSEVKETTVGTAASHLRRWIRRGMKAGAIRKPAKSKSASEGRKAQEPENPLQPWHEAIAPLVPPAEFRLWLRPLRHEGQRLIAQSQFHASHVQTHYGHLIGKVLPGVKIVHETQPKEKELCTQ